MPLVYAAMRLTAVSVKSLVSARRRLEAAPDIVARLLGGQRADRAAQADALPELAELGRQRACRAAPAGRRAGSAGASRVGVSKFESSRICSRARGPRFWASSRMSTAFWPARRRSIRKRLSATSRWAVRAAGAWRCRSPPACTRESRRRTACEFEDERDRRYVLVRAARAACGAGSSCPVPTSPVRRMKPLRSWTP